MIITNIRNPRYSSAGNATIDVTLELDGETMDFTASPNDVTDHGLDIYERAAAGEFGAIAAYVAPPAMVPASISRRQCAKAMWSRDLISANEAKAMTRAGTPPAMVQAMIDALPTQVERDAAEIDFAADTYLRSNPLLVALMTATGASSGDIDDFFREAAAL